MRLFIRKEFSKVVFVLQMLKWMYPWREMKRLEIVTELENFILKKNLAFDCDWGTSPNALIVYRPMCA